MVYLYAPCLEFQRNIEVSYWRSGASGRRLLSGIVGVRMGEGALADPGPLFGRGQTEGPLTRGLGEGF